MASSDEHTPTAALGVLCGISWVSAIDYYKGINEQYGKLRGKRKLMPPNPAMVMSSVDCDEYASMLVAAQWDSVATYLADGVARLVQCNCNLLVIASNTGHIAVPEVRKRYPKLQILHIADCTAHAIKAKGLRCVGLLGTEPTMREAYLKDQLGHHGIETLVPEADADLKQIFHYIMTELGHNKFEPDTRSFFLDQIQKLVARGAEGVILGCTEIELLVQQPHIPDVPLFPSAELHIAAAARVICGHASVGDYAPH